MEARTRTDPKPDGPIVVRLGRTTVRIYPRAADRGRSAGFLLADYSAGKRRLRWFTDLKEAKSEAVRIAALMNAGDAEGASMTGEDRRQLTRATQLVAPFDLDAPTACALFADAAKLVGPHAVVAAAEAYARLHPATRERIPIAKCIEAFQASKEAKGRSRRHLSTLRSILGRFLRDHQGKATSDFTTADLQAWLDGLRRKDGKPVSAQTRKSHATVVGSVFEHARRRGVIAQNPCRDLERESSDSEGDVEFWTPDEAAALLAAADPILVPGLAIPLFAGVRSAEVCRLTWRAVDFDQGHVEIGAKGSKTRSRRLAPLMDNLRAWLRPLRGEPDAKIFPQHPDTFCDLVTQAAKRAGVRRIRNGARHSFVSYRVAQTGDVARTALECGNSPGVVFAHYRGLATREDAERYFGIVPQIP
ncbi:MAG: tyrosine-type recombinase/integrase [Verrucomicrobiae bacterium]|nr:tyrosine-type recombinase/integrase [Verrucomicrobiae bacterium]